MRDLLPVGDTTPCSFTLASLLSISKDDEVIIYQANNVIPTKGLTAKWCGTHHAIRSYKAKNTPQYHRALLYHDLQPLVPTTTLTIHPTPTTNDTHPHQLHNNPTQQCVWHKGCPRPRKVATCWSHFHQADVYQKLTNNWQAHHMGGSITCHTQSNHTGCQPSGYWEHHQPALQPAATTPPPMFTLTQTMMQAWLITHCIITEATNATNNWPTNFAQQHSILVWSWTVQLPQLHQAGTITLAITQPYVWQPTMCPQSQKQPWQWQCTAQMSQHLVPYYALNHPNLSQSHQEIFDQIQYFAEQAWQAHCCHHTINRQACLAHWYFDYYNYYNVHSATSHHISCIRYCNFTIFTPLPQISAPLTRTLNTTLCCICSYLQWLLWHLSLPTTSNHPKHLGLAPASLNPAHTMTNSATSTLSVNGIPSLFPVF